MKLTTCGGVRAPVPVALTNVQVPEIGQDIPGNMLCVLHRYCCRWAPVIEPQLLGIGGIFPASTCALTAPASLPKNSLLHSEYGPRAPPPCISFSWRARWSWIRALTNPGVRSDGGTASISGPFTAPIEPSSVTIEASRMSFPELVTGTGAALPASGGLRSSDAALPIAVLSFAASC